MEKGKQVADNMQNISVEGEKINVRLNKSLYSKKAIELAAKQFCNACDSEIKTDNKVYYITLMPKSKDLCKKEIGLLFCNFALAAMQTI